MEDKDAIKVMSVLVVFICMILILSGCSVKPKDQVQTYKIQLGKKCTLDGDVYSYVWLHTVYGEDIVKEKYCR